ncbi:hypothetical protein F5146DRAFT_1124281, partial [Armillaria mellea]
MKKKAGHPRRGVVEYRHLNLASFASVHEFVRAFKASEMSFAPSCDISMGKHTTEDGLSLLY